jgi:hypothetical protein
MPRMKDAQVFPHEMRAPAPRPPLAPDGLGQYGTWQGAGRERYLFGSRDEAVTYRSPEGKYLEAPTVHAPQFRAIKAGPTSRDLNAPGTPSQKRQGHRPY